MKDAIYRGYRIQQYMPDMGGWDATPVVIVETSAGIESLPSRLDIRNHSPTGFEWGYGGSGPAQLALAIIAHAFGDEYAVPSVYQTFKRRFVQRLAHDGWCITSDEVGDLMGDMLQERCNQLGNDDAGRSDS